jgi:hypothetical protein
VRRQRGLKEHDVLTMLDRGDGSSNPLCVGNRAIFLVERNIEVDPDKYSLAIEREIGD